VRKYIFPATGNKKKHPTQSSAQVTPWKRIDTIAPQESAMKLLLDEMYTGLKDHLEVLGWEVETVRDAGISGKRDREIADHAKKHGLLLVTQDQKPAELSKLLGVKHVFITNAAIAAMVDREIKAKYPQS